MVRGVVPRLHPNALANLFGAVGILYEQAGVNAAAVKQASGQVLTYREAVHHQLVSTLANLETLEPTARPSFAISSTTENGRQPRTPRNRRFSCFLHMKTTAA